MRPANGGILTLATSLAVSMTKEHYILCVSRKIFLFGIFGTYQLLHGFFKPLQNLFPWPYIPLGILRQIGVVSFCAIKIRVFIERAIDVVRSLEGINLVVR